MISWVPAACLILAAALVAVPTRRVVPRLRQLHPAPHRAAAERRPGGQRSGWDTARLGAVLGGVAIAAVIGGWLGLMIAVPSGLVLDRALRGLEPRTARTERLRAEADLPLAADLLGAVLHAGAPVDRGSEAVGAALGGPLGERLTRVARALRLGASSDEAWAHLGEVPGADRLARAAIRSSTSGAALAAALSRLAEEVRANRLTAADAAARRAGVLVVLPLGLCFLPAFVLAGLVPVIVAVLGDVL